MWAWNGCWKKMFLSAFFKARFSAKKHLIRGLVFITWHPFPLIPKPLFLPYPNPSTSCTQHVPISRPIIAVYRTTTTFSIPLLPPSPPMGPTKPLPTHPTTISPSSVNWSQVLQEFLLLLPLCLSALLKGKERQRELKSESLLLSFAVSHTRIHIWSHFQVLLGLLYSPFSPSFYVFVSGYKICRRMVVAKFAIRNFVVVPISYH